MPVDREVVWITGFDDNGNPMYETIDGRTGVVEFQPGEVAVRVEYDDEGEESSE